MRDVKVSVFRGAISVEEESTEKYFRRMLKPLKGNRRGLILPYELTSKEQENPFGVVEIWHELQDKILDG